jgi:hypothetical protein
MCDRKAPFCDGSVRSVQYTPDRMGLLCHLFGKKCFSFIKSAIQVRWLQREDVIKSRADIKLKER